VRLHGNAKLVPSTRLLLVRRVLEENWKVADAATAQCVSERTVYRWLARWRAGDRRLVDRSSAPTRVPRRTPRAVEELIERLRRLRSPRLASRHTDCGMLTFTNDDLRKKLSDERGVDASGVDFLPFPDLEESVRDDVSAIKASPLLPDGIEVTGWVYDVKTGKISPVS
jgi:transposase